jgi:hypothetical protein
MTKWRIPNKYIFGQCEVKKCRRSYRLLKQLNKYDKYTFDLRMFLMSLSCTSYTLELRKYFSCILVAVVSTEETGLPEEKLIWQTF